MMGVGNQRVLLYRRDQFTMNIVDIPQGAGSGTIWDSSGHIVTNYHVIKGANELQVCQLRHILA